MENTVFKTAMFGGFDKADVVAYIEKFSAEATQTQRELNQQLQVLQQDFDQEKADWQAEQTALQEALTQAQAQVAELEEKLKSQGQTLETVEAEAQAYDRFKQHIATIEVEAKDRAEKLEAESLERTHQWESETQQAVEAKKNALAQELATMEAETQQRLADMETAVRTQLRAEVDAAQGLYQSIQQSFVACGPVVMGELRKIEAGLLQMPTAMKQMGTLLESLDAQVHSMEDETEIQSMENSL